MRLTLAAATMFSLAARRTAAFTVRPATSRAITGTSLRFAEEGQAEVVLVGCGAPNRGTSSSTVSANAVE